MSVGIEQIAAYVPSYALSLRDLAVARNVPPEKMTAGLGVHEMAIPAPCEDVVTLAASAGLRCLRRAGVDPGEIGMLLLATETGVDHSKPVGIFDRIVTFAMPPTLRVAAGRTPKTKRSK